MQVKMTTLAKNRLRSIVQFSSKLLALLRFLAVFALPTSLMAHAGDLDPTFGTGGIVTTPNSGANAAALQSNGKILVAGTVQNSQQPQTDGKIVAVGNAGNSNSGITLACYFGN